MSDFNKVLLLLVVLASVIVAAPTIGDSPNHGDSVVATPAPVPTETPSNEGGTGYEDSGDEREAGGFGEELGGDPVGHAKSCDPPALSSTNWRRGVIAEYQESCHG